MNIVLVFTAVWLLQYRVRINAAQCIHLPDVEKQKKMLQLQNEMFRDYLLGNWAYNVMHEYRRNTRPPRPNNLKDVQTRQTWFHGEKSCRKSRNITHYSDIGSNSTCPWYIILDVDLQREPRSIAKAKCSCSHCDTVGRRGKSTDRCTEMNSFIPVIKWRCQQNISGSTQNYLKYFVDFETVPVGCYCKRPNEVAN